MEYQNHLSPPLLLEISLYLYPSPPYQLLTSRLLIFILVQIGYIVTQYFRLENQWEL